MKKMTDVTIQQVKDSPLGIKGWKDKVGQPLTEQQKTWWAAEGMPSLSKAMQGNEQSSTSEGSSAGSAAIQYNDAMLLPDCPDTESDSDEDLVLVNNYSAQAQESSDNEEPDLDTDSENEDGSTGSYYTVRQQIQQQEAAIRLS